MKCPLCNFEFDEKKAKDVCAECLMVKNCGLIKCPNCSYEFPKTPKWIDKIISKERKTKMNLLNHEEEEMLETLWRKIMEDKTMPDLNALKDNEAFKGLIEKKYIILTEKQILTKKGFEEGKNCVRRHRLAERLLSDVLSVTGKEIHKTGCELEHILHKGLEDSICTLLGHPLKCPHGRPIPRGLCCEKNLKDVKKFILSLDELNKGQKAKIAYIQTEDNGLLKKIIAMGILPGLSVKLLHKFPSYVVKVGESQFAVDKEFASKIKVSPLI